MNKALARVLLVVGLLLIISGVVELSSASAEFSRVFPGSPPDLGVWLLIGGLVLAVLGAGGLLRGSISMSDDC